MKDLKQEILEIYKNELRPPSYRYIAKKTKCSAEYVRIVINDYRLGKIAVPSK